MTPPLPSGTLSFLFTDIEGSTRSWEQHPDAMREALAQHDALVEAIVSRTQGALVRPRGEGDSRFAVFTRASDAVVAACDILRSLKGQAGSLGRLGFVRLNGVVKFCYAAVGSRARSMDAAM